MYRSNCVLSLALGSRLASAECRKCLESHRSSMSVASLAKMRCASYCSIDFVILHFHHFSVVIGESVHSSCFHPFRRLSFFSCQFSEEALAVIPQHLHSQTICQNLNCLLRAVVHRCTQQIDATFNAPCRSNLATRIKASAVSG